MSSTVPTVSVVSKNTFENCRELILVFVWINSKCIAVFFYYSRANGHKSQLQACSSYNSTHYVHLFPAVNLFLTLRYPFSAGSTEAIRGRESCSRTQHDGTWGGSNPRPCGHGANALLDIRSIYISNSSNTHLPWLSVNARTCLVLMHTRALSVHQKTVYCFHLIFF
jgi:hypothetical protein